MERIALARRAVEDLRRIGPGAELRRMRRSLEALATDAQDLDVKLLADRTPWMRLRVGDYRVLYRPVTSDEPSEASYLVARVVHRGDLERAVDTLE